MKNAKYQLAPGYADVHVTSTNNLGGHVTLNFYGPTYEHIAEYLLEMRESLDGLIRNVELAAEEGER